MRILSGYAVTGALIAVLLPFATIVRADTIWTDWTKVTLGPDGGGSARGSAGAIDVCYSGELDGDSIAGLSAAWAPDGTFTGGTVTTGPGAVGDDLRLDGSFTGTNTITFSSVVGNPVLAIWSLGAPSFGASFTFNQTPTLEAGGPNSQFGGLPITVLGNVVTGHEGNGVVQFTGSFRSISWAGTFENYYAFTVGTNQAVELPAAVPEPAPSTLLLFALGLLVLVHRRHRSPVLCLQRKSPNNRRASR